MDGVVVGQQRHKLKWNQEIFILFFSIQDKHSIVCRHLLLHCYLLQLVAKLPFLKFIYLFSQLDFDKLFFFFYLIILPIIHVWIISVFWKWWRKLWPQFNACISRSTRSTNCQFEFFFWRLRHCPLILLLLTSAIRLINLIKRSRSRRRRACGGDFMIFGSINLTIKF